MSEFEPAGFAQAGQFVANPEALTSAQTEQVETMGMLDAVQFYGTLTASVGVVAAVAVVGIFRRGNSDNTKASEPIAKLTWGCLRNIQEANPNPSITDGIGGISCGGEGVEGCTYKLKRSGKGVSSEGSCKLRPS